MATHVHVRSTAKRLREIILSGFGYAVMLLLIFTVLIPFVMMITDSLKSEMESRAWPRVWLPNPPQWRNYWHVLVNADFALYGWNSIKLAVLVTVGSVLSCAWAGYGFARIDFRTRDALFIFILTAMMLPGTITMIPLFLVYHRLGWINTHYPLWITAWFGSPFGIFLTRQFFSTVPQELCDAARIDGCNDYGIFARIMLPLAGPTLATVGLFAFLGSWNNLMGPVLYLYSEALYTLPMGLTKFRGMMITHWGHSMAATTLSLLPLMGVFLFSQRFFVRGVILSGMK